MKTAEELSWAYLLREGGVSKTWNSLHGKFVYDEEATKKMYEDILEAGVDFKGSSGPYDGFEDEFDGTFSDDVRVVTLSGHLKTKSGKKYYVSCVFNEPKNVFKVLQEFSTIVSIEDVVRAKLIKKL